MKTLKLSLITFGSLQIADVVTTLHILAHPDGVELNPIVAALMNVAGDWWWLAKLASVGAVMVLFARARATRTIAAVTVFSGLVLINNLVALAAAR